VYQSGVRVFPSNGRTVSGLEHRVTKGLCYGYVDVNLDYNPSYEMWSGIHDRLQELEDFVVKQHEKELRSYAKKMNPYSKK